MYFSICLCLLQFLSSMLCYNFPSTGLLSPKVILFLFIVMVNELISLISLCDSSLLVYTNVTDFCILLCILKIYQFHWWALVVFWWCLKDFLGIVSCLLQTVRVLLPAFHFISFITFSSLIGVARASRTKLNKSGESGHPCLLPDLRGNNFSCSLLSTVLAVHLTYVAFIMLKYVHSMHTFWRVFIIIGCWILSKDFSCLLRWSYSFYSSVCSWHVSHWFVDIGKCLHSLDKFHLMVNYHFNILLNSVCWYFVEGFFIYVHQWYWPVIYFCCGIFYGFCIRIMLD